ncbi:MAG: hypothetical protein ABMB14_11385 [Myxococcota bacterium]
MQLLDPVSLAIALVAAVVAVAIGYVQWPRPPTLDGERWFKLTLCTLLRGRLDAAGATADAWEREVVRIVPYHPAGRLPERKWSNPVAAAVPGIALPGEHALLEALAREPDPARRIAVMYDTDEAGLAARFSDPSDLGEAYDYRQLGPGASWDALAAWGAGDRTFADAALRSLGARWVTVAGRADRLAGPSVLDAIAAEVPDTVAIRRGDDVSAAIRAVVTGPGVRLVLVAEEAAAIELLRLLADAADLRDQVVAVVAIGGVIAGRPDEDGPLGETACRDWLAAHLNQVDLDTDVVRRTPYFAVQWLDRASWPPGARGLPLQASRFPPPEAVSGVPDTIETVDLGPLPSDRDLPVELVARALVAVVCGWVRSRR